MFRHFSARFALISGLSLLAFVPDVSAQLLTGYGATEPVFEESVSVDDEPDMSPVEVASASDFQPRLTGHDPVPVASAASSVSVNNDLETNSYSNFLTSPVNQNKPSNASGVQPLDIEADSMRYNDVERIVTAEGNVIIVQDGRILRADEVQYAIDHDRVKAKGNVVLNETNGDIHFSQDVEYSDKLQNGSVHDLRTVLNDGSRFTAEEGRREEGKRTIMETASYTACEACKNDPDADVPWKIVASKVTHDEEAARISYRNARFNVYGVPVAYTPYFSHPDGTVKRKSGLLSPSMGYSSDLGAFVRTDYYWAIAPDKDATFGVQAMTDQAPLGLLEYRQRWGNAGIKFNGGVTYSDRVDDSGSGRNVTENDELRGHVFGEGLWDINDKWRSGFGIEYVSDDQYARQYDITDEDVLKNTLYVERFSGRDYATGLVQVYKDIRVSERQVDQPWVLPEMYASFIGEPGDIPFLKGRWDATFGLLSLFRDGNQQDVVRGSADLGWKRRLVSDYGLVSDVDLTLRGDAYQISDPDFATTNSGRESDSLETRFFPQIHAQASYPMARNFEKAQMLIEPLVAVTAAPKIDANEDIPNEDSQDVQLDASNLFEPNRFPGLDLVEDQTRVTYGMRTALNGYENSDLEFFLGQSYRLDNESNPFASGSGLDNKGSDIVGYLKGSLSNRYTTQYRFQLDNETLNPERHEFDAYADWNRFRLGVNYLYAKPISGTEITETREQVSSNAEYYLNKKWRMSLGAQYDLGTDPGLRKGVIGLDYFGQCVYWSLQGARTITDDSSGDNDAEVLFRIGLRNISEFYESGLRDE